MVLLTVSLETNHYYLIFEGTKLLFDVIKDIHSEKGLEEITLRHIEYKKRLKELRPKLI